ncbi:MAG: hypothetical protein GC164_07335 [Phycisphaera sp.]|nr:hypothetical protein [Phycisphaera sp.]
MSKRMLILLVVTLLLDAMTAVADQTDRGLELSAPFTDNMILQRGVKVPVWGFDVPGRDVTVSFAGQTKSVKADDRGEWRTDLDPLVASFEERIFTVSNNTGQSIELKRVLVGEVWFSSGQSNMVWLAGKSMCSDLARELANAKDEAPVREISINTVSALYPQKRATSDGGWKSSRDASNFSALSLSFAYELYKQLNVPVGILLSAHSNTRIEAFTQRQAIEAHPLLKVDADLIHDGDVLTDQGRNAFEQYYKDLKDWQKRAIEISEAGGTIPARPNLPGIAGLWRGPSQFFSGKINPVVPYAVRGAIWCQGTSNSGDSRIYAARMEALVKGWRDAWNMPNMPFYFTQMQPYGSPDPDNVGFADIRQAQFKFFLDNRKNVGMVVQTDLNSANPGGIHYFNKLHPGLRLARWALAHEYGKDVAYTGPIYEGYKIEGDKVTVSFEKESLFGGLMVGNKGMEKDYRTPGKFVEPAVPTPGVQLNHFRLCGEDRKWHAAEAQIVGDAVVVTSKDVPKPIGVQYAYSAVPENSNLYNKAGLPATPFAAVNGELIFQEDKLAALPDQQTVHAGEDDTDSSELGEAPALERPMLHIAEYYRPGVIVQRDKPIPVWGHANAGVKVTVKLGDHVMTTTANDLEQWSVRMPAMVASTQPITLVVEASNGRRGEVGNILVGDVWYLTGGSAITNEMAYDPRAKDAKVPEALPWVREFKRNTKASTDASPRKRRFETGGGKYRSHWLPADYAVNDAGVTMFAYTFAKTLNRPGVPQGFVSMSSGAKGQMASPLSWTSYAGVRDLKAPEFRARLNELFLQYPESDVAKAALDLHIEQVKACVITILDIAKRGGDLSTAPLGYPKFPTPGSSPDVRGDEVPTYAYNWCVSPLTPMAVAGVIWVPTPESIGYRPAEYADELEAYARSLPKTYGQDKVLFIYAQPSEKLVAGITSPTLPGARSFPLDAWPKSFAELARQMATLAESNE